MSTYRLYLLNAMGQITWDEWFEAAGPDEALRVAQSRCKGGVARVEISQGVTCIHSFRCPEQALS